MTIVFAMIVAVDTSSGDERFRDLCIGFAAVSVIMTMIFNRPTIIWFTEYIGLAKVSLAHKKLVIILFIYIQLNLIGYNGFEKNHSV